MSTEDLAIATLKQIIYDKSGNKIDNANPNFLSVRLHTLLEQHKVDSLAELLKLISTNNDILDDVIDLATTHESLFFRDDLFFKSLSEAIFPYFYKARESTKKLRIWSAASSYGQEATSLAISLITHPCDFSGWDIQILGTDISKNVIKRANSGIYTHYEVQRGLSCHLLARFFERADAGWKIKDELKKMTRFENLNLLNSFQHLGEFDIVLIRNVLIYFEPDIKKRILENINSLLPTDGCLGLGGPETTLGITNVFKTWEGLQCSLYQKNPL
ncbi:protein-glutamate O-methyltransferase CheR [bacterium]|nr:protein-glutamate O-methyltransferase CheR [bacterium]